MVIFSSKTKALSIRGGSQPTIDGGVVYVGFSDGILAALNSFTGQIGREKRLSTHKNSPTLTLAPLSITAKYISVATMKTYFV